MTCQVVLLTVFEGPEFARLVQVSRGQSHRGKKFRNPLCANLQQWQPACGVRHRGVVPKAFLDRLHRKAYNVHAASPEFPGRDPHHFAIYQQMNRYGATLHIMTEQVDAGRSLRRRLFDVPDGCRPQQLLRLANEAGFRLIEVNAKALIGSDDLPILGGQSWGELSGLARSFLKTV